MVDDDDDDGDIFLGLGGIATLTFSLRMVIMVTIFSSDGAGDPVMSRIFCRFHWEQQRETVTICDQCKKAGRLDTHGICSLSHPKNDAEFL